MVHDEGSAEWFKREALRWARRMGIVGIQAVAFAACVALHMGASYCLHKICPPNYVYLTNFVEGVIVLIFSVIYLVIALDTLVIFVPALSGLKETLVNGPSRGLEDEKSEKASAATNSGS